MFPELFLVKASPPLLCKYSTNSGKFPAPDRLRTCSNYDYYENYGQRKGKPNCIENGVLNKVH